MQCLSVSQVNSFKVWPLIRLLDNFYGYLLCIVYSFSNSELVERGCIMNLNVFSVPYSLCKGTKINVLLQRQYFRYKPMNLEVW